MPCDEEHNYLPPGTLPPPNPERRSSDDWTPYSDRHEFEMADFLYRRAQMSGANIDNLFDLWAAKSLASGDLPPFVDAADLYDTIDSTPLGDVPWQNISLKYTGTPPDDRTPAWMTAVYEAWFRDPHAVVKTMIGNPDYKEGFDVAPIYVSTSDGQRKYQNFMSGDWAWKEAVSHILNYISVLHSNYFRRTR
jgi:hypothetical protein